MTFYSDLAAVADELLLELGFDATIRAAASASDPVTGSGGSDGSTRTVRAVQTQLDETSFAASSVGNGDRMFIFGGRVERGEYFVDADGDWAVLDVTHVEPDNSTHLITKALVSG